MKSATTTRDKWEVANDKEAESCEAQKSKAHRIQKNMEPPDIQVYQII